ncbi:hypothetical protein L6232_20920, partial [Shewanella sp. C31]|nr:hypothetical protein [Shewanella electrica]
AFGTARVRLAFGLVVDLAESREEVYPYPGAVPQVRPAPIAKDLERRDYTVNAMALALATLELLDPYGGFKDLEARLVRSVSLLSHTEMEATYRVETRLENPYPYPVTLLLSETFPQPFRLDFPGATLIPEGYRLELPLKPGEARVLTYRLTLPR